MGKIVSFVRMFHENRTEVFLNFFLGKRYHFYRLGGRHTGWQTFGQHEFRSLAVYKSRIPVISIFTELWYHQACQCLYFVSRPVRVRVSVRWRRGPWPPFLQRLCALAASRCSSWTCNMVGSSRFHLTIPSCASTMVFTTQKRWTIKWCIPLNDGYVGWYSNNYHQKGKYR